MRSIYSKAAVTFFASDAITTHEAPPLHAPPHPMNLDPVAGSAERVTNKPSENKEEQESPQSIPGGSDRMTPLPTPSLETAIVH